MREKGILVVGLISMLLMAAFASTGTGVHAAPIPKVFVDPAAIIDRTGGMDPPNTFSVDINVEGVTELYGWSVRMLYNPSILQVVDAELGTWLGDASGWGVWPFLSIRNDLGYVFCGQMLNPFEDPTNGATGSGNLATITFQVIGFGVTTLELDPTALNTVIAGQNVPIDHKAEDGLFDNRPVIASPHALLYIEGLRVEKQPLTFDASASHDNDDGGWITAFEWDFNYDGITFDVETTGMIVTHAFLMRDTYTIALRVTDNDGLTDIISTDIVIVNWMDGGNIPDLVGWEAKAEMPRLNESPDLRGMDLRSQVGNPTDGEYEVYTVFTLYSKDEAKKLGTLTTETAPIGPREKFELRSYFDASDPTWRCFSGSPEWVGFGYYHWFFHKYIVFASCYYKNSTMSDFEKANVVKYFHFNVDPMHHDIGIVDVTASPTEVPVGGIVEIEVNVTNRGDLDENVNLELNYVGVGGVGGNIDTIAITLAPGENKTLTFTWDTTGLGPGPYLVIAKLPILPYETEVGDNSLNAKVTITA